MQNQNLQTINSSCIEAGANAVSLLNAGNPFSFEGFEN